MNVTAYEIAINFKYDENQRALSNMVYNISDKKSRLGVSVSEQLAE